MALGFFRVHLHVSMPGALTAGIAIIPQFQLRPVSSERSGDLSETTQLAGPSLLTPGP